ncbi:ribonuclease R [Thermosyntropha sp.]|uniref:ribonuclease R n=1 Tax=Thermosyntropha sp. TaxID=2740820 RepID=UPI0025CC9208|nr:ribonuclease R [Thermosyntropha sp.]MBO8158980.1 ribonuclease R [Thermosyntropha sp.]
MISREAILDYIKQASYRPLSYRELLEVFEIGEEEEEKFKKILGRLEKEGEIVKTRKNKYGLPEMMNLVKGIIRLSQWGYGILVPDDPEWPEIFVYGRNLNGAMHNDKVMVRVHSRGKVGGQRPEGEVIRVINRANKELVGTVKKGKHTLQVIPDDSRQIYPIYVKPSRKMKASNGDKVLVSITAFPDKDRYPEGKIIEVLGRKGEAGLDLQVIIKKHNLRAEFPPEVIKEAKEVAKPVSREEVARRRDLRDLRMVTIDGEDAKDLDDAVSIERTDKGYRLGVHIADVSHYVREGSKLDKEAFLRGTSVYLIDKVLPMLPPELSNDICSLNAGKDRLAISCLMDIDDRGRVISYDICKSVINVNERMTYTDVNKILVEDDKETKEKYAYLVEDFLLMKELADIIRAERMKRGALDFNFPESKVIVDENSRPIEIKRREHGPAEMLIEDFMIKANEVVAEHMYWQELPILYRVHEKPDEEALSKVNMVLGVFGYKIPPHARVEPRTYQKILDEIKGKPEEGLLSMILLRSMKHARYMPDPLGHFGLASKYYCHFTSPIRRYPDLIVHRVLTLLLRGGLRGKKRASLEKKMPVYGEQSTQQEIKAEEAERELVDIKKAQYMQQFLGEEFTGRISSVQPFGFFVELSNTVEGLVHISTIADDYYEFNERSYILVGVHTGRKFAIGDEVRVQLVKVDVDDGKIDFELVED